MLLYHLPIYAVTTVPIRLAGRNSHYYGRVEVYYNGEWGTVCDDGWDNTDATVACRQLGFYSWVIAYGSAQYGHDNIECGGSESSVFACRHNTFGEHNCEHYEDAGVVCLGESSKGINACKKFIYVVITIDLLLSLQ